MEARMNPGQIEEFCVYLTREERSPTTIVKYTHDVRAFYIWMPAEKRLDKGIVLSYKEKLLGEYAVASVNSALAALNSFFKFIDRRDCAVKSVKAQHKIYCECERELTKAEYLKLVAASNERGNRRLSLIMQTICSTGIRVSELQFITVEAARSGRTEVRCKGKQRVVLLPRQLCRQLLAYTREQILTAGPIFVTKGGLPMNRSNIWMEMKRLCKRAGVSQSKVFPHNLRHLFARTFYALEKDLARLADLLGHSSIDTTRIYMISTGREHMKKIERLGLVI